MILIPKKYGGFTLIEVLLVTIIIGIIFPLMISIYTSIIRANKEFIARQSAIQQGYEFLEKINILMQDYTIDYEEYYNRQMVGCVGSEKTGSGFEWNIGTGGYCTNFTAYGNENSTSRHAISVSGGYHDIYKCSSKEGRDVKGFPLIVKENDCGKRGTKQSYGQYAALFTDVKQIIDEGDDEDLGTTVNPNIQAIRDKDNIQELYLISHDGKSRLFFRRKLFTGDNIQSQYKIQILRLRGFDAGRAHNFVDSEGLYDGQIDTWACDKSMGFEPKNKADSNKVGGAYSDYYLPQNVDDCWVDLTYGNTNVASRKLSISPQGDPELFWAQQDHQINPYMKIFMINGLYLPLISSGSVGSSILDFKIPLETTINMKNFYTE